MIELLDLIESRASELKAQRETATSLRERAEAIAKEIAELQTLIGAA